MDHRKLKLQHYQHPDLFGKLLGYRLLDLKPKRARAELIVKKDHLSPANRVHGGVISGFVDFACGAAVFSTLEPEDLTATIEMKVNYLRQVFLGERLRATARVIFRGKRLVVIECLVEEVKSGEAAAVALSTFNVRPKDRASPPKTIRRQKA